MTDKYVVHPELEGEKEMAYNMEKHAIADEIAGLEVHQVYPQNAEAEAGRPSSDKSREMLGLSPTKFKRAVALLAATLVALIIGLAVGLGVGLHRSTTDTASSSPSSQTQSAVAASTVATSTVQTQYPTATMALTPSASIASKIVCPRDNGTAYTNAGQNFRIYCNATASSGKKLSDDATTTFSDCVDSCARMDLAQATNIISAQYDLSGTTNQLYGQCSCLSSTGPSAWTANSQGLLALIFV